MRRRLGGLGGGGGKDKLLKFYTDDAPGLKLPPVRVPRLERAIFERRVCKLTQAIFL